jgi:tellurite resistance protein
VKGAPRALARVYDDAMAIDRRIKKLAKGLSARQAADAFVRAQEDPQSLSDADRGKADEFEATVECMFLMAAVDGDIGDDELSQLSASVEAFAELEQIGRVDLGATLAKMNDRLASEGWNKRLAVVASRLRDPESRSFAFRLAAGVAFVDDHVAHAEAAALEALAGALHLSSDESQEILYDVRETLFS